jgi:carboxymethylenebutenolidase
MKTVSSPEVDRRTLLKGAAAGVVGAAVVGNEVAAQDKGALKDSKIVTEMVTFKNGADSINGFLVRPKAAGKHGSVILIPGIFGVEDYVKETAAQLAQAGLVALAVDFYSRKGGAPKTDDFTVLRAFVTENAPDKQIVSDGLAAIEYLKKQSFANGKFGVTGFCMGGRITLLIAEESPSILAAAPFYGPIRATSPVQVAPIDQAGKIKAHVQGHYGATDMNPKPDDVKEFYAKLKETNSHSEYFIYDGAGHGFHAYNRPSYNAEVAKTAWGRATELFQKTLK